MAQGSGDGLVRWLVGGLAGGVVVLGLLIGAYAIGYNRGQDSVKPNASPPPATTAPAPPPPTPTQPTASASRGKQLFTTDACTGCHSLDGSAGVGPTLKGLGGSRVALADGTTVTADDAYLARALTDPDAQIVKGYKAGTMSAATASFGLKSKPDDVAALVAYLKSLR